MPIYNSTQTKSKLYSGNQKVKKAYIGSTLVYSSGNIVTYHVDSGTSFQEEIEDGSSCLSPKSFSPTKAGWTFVGWREDGTASKDVLSSKNMNGATVTLYAVFKQTVTVTYYNSANASATSGSRWYNNGKVANPSFTLTQTSLSGWSARGWSFSTAGNGGIVYNNAAAFTVDSNITLYGMYQQIITVTYYNGSTTASKATGTRYYNVGSGSKINPSFTLSQASLSGWSVRGWSTSNVGNGSITYNNAAAFTRESNITLYGMYQQTITLTLYNGSTSASKYTGTRYYNSGSGNTTNPAFSVSAASLSGYSFNGWASSSSATAGISYSVLSGTTFAANTTLYGRYSQTITLSYHANGGSGTTSAQSGTRYWNTGNASNPSFTLHSNSFARSGYSFSKWALGSTGGTQYSAGTSITISSSTTMYAMWTSNSYYAIKDGAKVNAGSATAWCGGYGNGTGTCAVSNNVPKAYYGGWGHTNSTRQTWGASTGNLDTKECASLKVVYVNSSWSNAPDALITVTGISSSGSETTVSSEYMSAGSPLTKTYTVSSYQKVRIKIDASAGTNHNAWMNVGFHLVQFT